MKTSTIKYVLLLQFIFLITSSFAQDPNFHIYLCFGQSNMEGHGKFEDQDTITNKRIWSLQSVDCPNLNRKKDEWYLAQSPITRCNTGLTPADYFAKHLIANLPENISIGIINVSVGGCHIQLFDKDSTSNYVAKAPDWMKEILTTYDNNPYERLIEMAKIAQKKGIIKGILLHQGESNTGDKDWPNKVNLVYLNLIKDLSLENTQIPILAGELLSAEQGGKCASMNSIINTLPSVIPNAYVISSKNCEGLPDGLHFTQAGYRLLGRNYAEKILEIYNKTK